MINIMKNELKKLINQCGYIDLKVVVLLFILFVIIYSIYSESVKDEDCNCN